MAALEENTHTKARTGGRLPVGRRVVRVNRHHGRVVSLLKVVLPTMALALTLAVIAWPLLEEQAEQAYGITDAEREEARDIRITQASYNGMEDNESPFTLTAETALQKDPDSPEIDLEAPKGDVMWAGRSWYAVTAPKGRFNQDTETLEMWDGVSAFQDQGYEFRTENVVIDFASNSGYGLSPVEGQGPDLYVSAEGFRVYNMGERIELIGKSKVILRPSNPGS